MDITRVLAQNNDLADFVRWLDNSGIGDIDYDIEDWDTMCNVNVHALNSVGFQFYEDGCFRCIGSESDISQWAREQKSVKETISRMSWWELLTNRSLSSS